MPDASDSYLAGSRAAAGHLAGTRPESIREWETPAGAPFWRRWDRPAWIMGWEDTLAEHRELRPTRAELADLAKLGAEVERDDTADYDAGARAASLSFSRHGSATHGITIPRGKSEGWIMGWQDALAEDAASALESGSSTHRESIAEAIAQSTRATSARRAARSPGGRNRAARAEAEAAAALAGLRRPARASQSRPRAPSQAYMDRVSAQMEQNDQQQEREQYDRELAHRGHRADVEAKERARMDRLSDDVTNAIAEYEHTGKARDRAAMDAAEQRFERARERAKRIGLYPYLDHANWTEAGFRAAQAAELGFDWTGTKRKR